MDKDEEIFYDIIKSKKNLENENIKKAIDQFNIEFETAIKQQYSQIQSLTIDGIQFDSELFEKISKQIISQCPFHSLEQNDWQYTEKIQKFEKSKGASEWFIQLVDKNLVHFANFVVFKKTDEQFINNNKIDVIYFNKDIIIPPTNQNNEYYYQYITRTDFSLEQQKQQIGDLNSRQISLYFHKENLENLINAHQKLLGKNLQLQFIFYFNMALLRKLFINYDFYGVPLTEKEFVIKDFSKSMKKIFLLYTESWSCYLKKQPYIENIKINREEYKISQNFYLSEIQFQLNLENYE
ncbi:hypothetical protein TTHERM_00888010 (macronuclear) [Tetrahymena thermophila SB210]|uniref:Uncharacterized protein n=1 Tax=Tetrahymena thermophila (strain SB210) TaxID=312017 RepID=Q23U99_TETTS|nr:hypothetical protein TTHERM_00888010 [Tetrahymena thermophila SB210]EAS00045.2 hypothetical protein TTHERM_00888010 [Tetrahymena thermophila SB210]|eukprot:XP_001020290.2 hypothetical protein TTHERM_00888010 [Tetrahymena thermophila SB210]